MVDYLCMYSTRRNSSISAKPCRQLPFSSKHGSKHLCTTGAHVGGGEGSSCMTAYTPSANAFYQTMFRQAPFLEFGNERLPLNVFSHCPALPVPRTQAGSAAARTLCARFAPPPRPRPQTRSPSGRGMIPASASSSAMLASVSTVHTPLLRICTAHPAARHLLKGHRDLPARSVAAERRAEGSAFRHRSLAASFASCFKLLLVERLQLVVPESHLFSRLIAARAFSAK